MNERIRPPLELGRSVQHWLINEIWIHLKNHQGPTVLLKPCCEKQETGGGEFCGFCTIRHVFPLLLLLLERQPTTRALYLAAVTLLHTCGQSRLGAKRATILLQLCTHWFPGCTPQMEVATPKCKSIFGDAAAFVSRSTWSILSARGGGWWVGGAGRGGWCLARFLGSLIIVAPHF